MNRVPGEWLTVLLSVGNERSAKSIDRFLVEEGEVVDARTLAPRQEYRIQRVAIRLVDRARSQSASNAAEEYLKAAQWLCRLRNMSRVQCPRSSSHASMDELMFVF
jgi:hypothetical protein